MPQPRHGVFPSGRIGQSESNAILPLCCFPIPTKIITFREEKSYARSPFLTVFLPHARLHTRTIVSCERLNLFCDISETLPDDPPLPPKHISVVAPVLMKTAVTVSAPRGNGKQSIRRFIAILGNEEVQQNWNQRPPETPSEMTLAGSGLCHGGRRN